MASHWNKMHPEHVMYNTMILQHFQEEEGILLLLLFFFTLYMTCLVVDVIAYNSN